MYMLANKYMGLLYMSNSAREKIPTFPVWSQGLTSHQEYNFMYMYVWTVQVSHIQYNTVLHGQPIIGG